MTEENNKEQNESIEQSKTIEVKIPVSDFHDNIIQLLSNAGVDIEDVLAKELQPRAEEVLHQFYQQSRHQQQ